MSYRIIPENGFSDYYFCKQIENPQYLPHVHSHIEFIFVLDGSLQISIDKDQRTLSNGALAVVMPYEPHSYQGKAKLFVLACPPEYITEYRQILKDKRFDPPYTTFTPTHEAIIRDIIDSNFQDNFKKKALLYYTVSRLMEYCLVADAPSFAFDVYRKALLYISENHAENITLETTAAYVGVTPSHLSRVLNTGNKPGFSEILNSIRVYAARSMLEQSAMNISEVAMAAGFGSIRNFNRLFKHHFGCNPSDIKR